MLRVFYKSPFVTYTSTLNFKFAMTALALHMTRKPRTQAYPMTPPWQPPSLIQNTSPYPQSIAVCKVVKVTYIPFDCLICLLMIMSRQLKHSIKKYDFSNAWHAFQLC